MISCFMKSCLARSFGRWLSLHDFTRSTNSSILSRRLSDSQESHSRKTSNRLWIFGYISGASFLYYYLSSKEKLSESQHDLIFEPVHDLEVHASRAKMFRCGDFILPDFIGKDLKIIREFDVRADDVIVASFPKSGTTWLQEIVYLLLTNFDFDGASNRNMEERVPYLEYVYPGVKALSRLPSPRIIKSHLPLSLLPKSVRNGNAGKVIYIARNPKDVCVSYYHFVRMLKEISYSGDFQGFVYKFLEGRVAYGPWWLHVAEFWTNRNQLNILFLTYEDLHQDFAGCVRRLAAFLGTSVTEEQLARLARHCSFESMSANPATNYKWWDDLGIRNKEQTLFFRTGKVGDWKNYLASETAAEFDILCRDKLQPIGLTFIS